MTTVESFFIIADEIQLLAAGKTMAVGIYADRVISLHVAPNHPPGFAHALAKLHMMVTMQGLPSGEQEVQAEIVFPDGTRGPKVRPVRILVLPEQSATVIFGFVPFPMAQEGRYLLSLHVAGKTVENHFTVMHATMQPEAAAAAGLPFSVTPAAAPKGAPSVFNRPSRSAAKAPAPAAAAVKGAASTAKKRTKGASEPAAKPDLSKTGRKRAR